MSTPATPTPAAVPSVGIITAANYPDGDPADPSRGLASTLELISAAEGLGYDTAGVRQRKLEHGSSSALTILAAASQRTRRIGLETSVVPLGFEVPFRLAEDFATVDALSQGRVTIGVSTSAPHRDLLDHLNRPDFSADTDPHELLDRFLEALRGEPLDSPPLPTPYGTLHPPAVLPTIPDALSKVWLGAGSSRSIDRAASLGLGIFLGNITGDDSAGSADSTGPVTDSTFTSVQRASVDRYRSAFHAAGPGAPGPRVAVERVIVPLDSASGSRRTRYLDFARSREERTLTRHRIGDRTVLFQRDLVGTADEIIERLHNDEVFDGGTGLRIALPYALDLDDYLQILTDIRELVLPELGWTPDVQGAGADRTPAHV